MFNSGCAVLTGGLTGITGSVLGWTLSTVQRCDRGDASGTAFFDGSGAVLSGGLTGITSFVDFGIVRAIEWRDRSDALGATGGKACGASLFDVFFVARTPVSGSLRRRGGCAVGRCVGGRTGRRPPTIG